jgi:hypothetical protein
LLLTCKEKKRLDSKALAADHLFRVDDDDYLVDETTSLYPTLSILLLLDSLRQSVPYVVFCQKNAITPLFLLAKKSEVVTPFSSHSRNCSTSFTPNRLAQLSVDLCVGLLTKVKRMTFGSK